MLSTLLRTAVATAAVTASAVAVPLLAAAPAHAAAQACSTSGTWTPGELNVYWFDVEQGDSQLIVGPTGKTLLVDLGERAWNSSGTGTMATRVANEIKAICGTGSSPVALDYVLVSHHHLDHIGYAHVPEDGASSIGNGLYQLLTPTTVPNGLGFTVGSVLDRDGGTWTDADSDGTCEVGTATAPAPEVDWNNVGTTSQTARRFICWLYGPAGQADRSHIDGKVTRLTNTGTWPTIDLGTGAVGTIANANGKGTLQADGVTPVSGDHSAAAVPPSENDYSTALKVTFGSYKYATAGDSDGEYATSGNGYTYNDIEAGLPAKFGNLNFDTVRANHHGSGHSSSSAYVNALDPESSVVSCGANSYGHPANRALDAFQSAGSDVFLTNNPCDTTDTTGNPIDYSGTLNTDGTVKLATTGGGTGYVVTYDSGSKTYVAGSGGGGGGDPTQVRVNELLGNPATGNEWIELYNPTAQTVDVSGYKVDDVAGGGGAPKTIPAGTTIPAGGRWVYEFAAGFLNNTGTDAARFTQPDGTELDAYTYTAGAAVDKVYRRAGDGGTWCSAEQTDPSKGTPNPATCGGGSGDASQVKVNEFMMAPGTGNEWIELHNPTSGTVDVSGYYVDDVAGGGGAPKVIAAGTTIPAGGRVVIEFASGLLNNTGADAARFTTPDGTELDRYDYNLGSTQTDKVFHRVADGGSWCATISANVTKGTANPATCP